MRLICISDTHSLHEQMPEIPDGDVLIHAGDCTGTGSLAALSHFTEWFGTLPHQHKILIAGNHDYCFEIYPKPSREMCTEHGVTYLRGEATRIGNLNFYGFPWQPIYRWMAFNAREGELRGRLQRVPDDTNVLISHGPAFNVFDYVPSERAHVGCHALANRIQELNELKAHICGHIHESYGFAVRESDGVKFANASTCTERYSPSNLPIVIDL
ncbi:Predicted phosphoesterase [Marinobacter sp. es.042]|uniref:metallophosphatase domain-containing protein n=1 Tax=Marinobacter sp. es.042 TaxID=1761794 RepID=UPI000B4FEEC5|nr:metallophosphatase domain-containing protein [Marinobacter sp. es.042]SNB59293.1 Predicted phosphoesterase [Marinobacter sp. es.042]